MNREVKEIEFSDISQYNQWVSSQNSFNDRFRVVGLNIIDSDKVIVKYIELF